MENKNIGIIGLGYVGLTLGIVTAMKNYNVYGVEKNEKIKESLRKNKAHFYEPGLNNLINSYQNNNFNIVDKFKREHNLDIIILTVGTPLKKNSNKPDFEYIKTALQSIEGIYDGSQLIVLRSTVPVGTTRDIVIPYLKNTTSNPKKEILVAFCPERTVEGKAINEIQSLPQIIGGYNKKSVNIAENFFRRITPFIIEVDSLEEAELIKLFNNTYRDILFSLGNVFNEIAQKFNLNGKKVIKYSNLGYKRSNISTPGFVGGPCLSKDSYILTYNLDDFEGRQFILKAREYNKSLDDKIVRWIDEKAHKYDINDIGLSGMTFKGMPETSDLRDSPSINIAKKLKSKGYNLYLHDFIANKVEVEEKNLGIVVDDFYDLTSKVGILAILNNNPNYQHIQIEKLEKKLNYPKIILDSWESLNLMQKYYDSTIYNLGNFQIKEGNK